MNGAAVPGSLSEGAGSPQGLTEGVSSDGCSMPTIHTPAHINSEIFEWLRSSGYTPSVSHSLDSSLREGAGNGCGDRYHSTGYLRNRGVTGDFHRPYETQKFFTFHHSTNDTPSVTPVGRDSSLREGAGNGRVPFIGDMKMPGNGGALPGIGGTILYLLPARIWASWEDSSRMTVFSEPVRLFFRASRARVKV